MRKVIIIYDEDSIDSYKNLYKMLDKDKYTIDTVSYLDLDLCTLDKYDIAFPLVEDKNITNKLKDFNITCVGNAVSSLKLEDIEYNAVVAVIGNKNKVITSKIAHFDNIEEKFTIPYMLKKDIENKIYNLCIEEYKALNIDNNCLMYLSIGNDIKLISIDTNTNYSKNNLLNTLFNYSNITNTELLEILINIAFDNNNSDNIDM